MLSSWPLLDSLVFTVSGVLMAWFGSIPVHYIGFVSVECVNSEYLPSGPAILKNVLEIHMVLLV